MAPSRTSNTDSTRSSGTTTRGDPSCAGPIRSCRSSTPVAKLPGHLCPTWPAEDLSGLPAAPPLNLLALVLRSKSLTRQEMVRREPRRRPSAAGLRPRHHRRRTRRRRCRNVSRPPRHDRAHPQHALRGLRPILLLQPGGALRRRTGGDVPLLLPRQPRGHRVRRPRPPITRRRSGTRCGSTSNGTAAEVRLGPGSPAIEPDGQGWLVTSDAGDVDDPARRSRASIPVRCVP